MHNDFTVAASPPTVPKSSADWREHRGGREISNVLLRRLQPPNAQVKHSSTKQNKPSLTRREGPGILFE